MPGVIAPQPNWILTDEEKKRVLPVKELFIDTGLLARGGRGGGLPRRPDQLRPRLRGAERPWSWSAATSTTASACTSLIDAVRRLGPLGVDLYAVATVQEELGVRGAEIAAYAIDPDVGIAIDGSLASDVPYAKEEDRHCSLGAGTGIYLVDNRTVSDPLLVRVPRRVSPRSTASASSGTSAAAPTRRRSSGTGRAPARARSARRPATCTAPRSSADVRDVEETVRLLVAFLENAHSLALR